MKKIALAALLAASLGAAHADVLTFDGVSSTTAVPNGYGDLNWSNLYSHTGVDLANYAGTGYVNGLVSGTQDAYNPNGTPATVSATSTLGFSLSDAYFTGAWFNNLKIVASATFENGTHDSKTFFVSTTGPVDEHFDWNGLASITFTASGGTPQAGLHGSGTQFVLDNFNTTPAVPEASNATLLLAGIGLLAAAARRRRIG